MNQERRCIVMAVNDPFAQYACVFLYSLKKHNPRLNVPMKVLMSPVLSPLSDENQFRIRSAYPNTEFISVDEKPFERFFAVTPPRLHPALIKLATFNIDADRVVFFDADMLCLGDVSELFDLDVPFGAVPAGKDRTRKEEVANSFRWRVGFNTGVMVIGKEHLTGGTYKKLLRSSLQPSPTADQDILNRFFRWKRIYCLDHRYNYHAEFFWRGDEKDVKILHYAGTKPLEKPDEPRMKLWFDYLSAFRNS